MVEDSLTSSAHRPAASEWSSLEGAFPFAYGWTLANAYLTAAPEASVQSRNSAKMVSKAS